MTSKNKGQEIPKCLTPALACILLLAFSASPLFAAGNNAQSVQDFLELKEKWPDLIGSSFRLEGRATITTKDYVKLKGCELTFRSSRPLPKLQGNSKVVEVSGRLAKENGGKLFIEIDSITELPTDLQTVKLRESGLPRGSAKEWYDLATWTAARGKFYDDDELLKRAAEINLKGLKIERQALTEITPAALRKLAGRADDLKLDDSLRLDLLHESFWLEWESLQKTAPPVDPNDERDWKKDPYFMFLERLDSELPGATTTSDNVLPLLTAEYRKNPVLGYRSANEASRRVLHRLFHRDVATAAITRITRPDGSNGTLIAEQIDELISEQHTLAEQHRDNELAFLVKNVAAASRTQLNDLVQRCHDRKQEALAKEAINRWLARRELSLRKDGVSGLIQLADDRLALLQDQAGAGSLLLEAVEQTPTNTDVIERLEKLGYRKVDEQWTHPILKPQPPGAVATPKIETERDRNIRLGVPEIGMTPAELLRCLGAPSSVTRIASSGHITETWTYREGTIIRHTATIDRPHAPAIAKVVAIQ